ncbi:MAG TPA: S8 family serine peptidase [Actinopolymorphaceae bacterium]
MSAGPLVAVGSASGISAFGTLPSGLAPTSSGTPDPGASGSIDPSSPTTPASPSTEQSSPSSGPTGQVVTCGDDPGDELDPKQWIDEENWATTWLRLAKARTFASGHDVTVAVIDTGLRENPQFVGTKVAERRAVDVIGNIVNTASAFLDCDGHGTGVASIIAAQPFKPSALVGVAPNAKILPIRVTPQTGAGKIEDLAEGIVWAVDNGADIINASLETETDFPALRQAVQYAGKKGVLIVAASGNNAKNGDPKAYPAYYSKEYSHVIAVGAIDQNGQRADFSGTSAVTVMAPGVGVLTAWPEAGNSIEEGTSFAAPYVSGVAALILDRFDKKLSPAAVRRRIEVTADAAPGRGQPDKEYGYGVVNPVEAVTAALPNLASAPPSMAPKGIPPLKPPAEPDHTIRNAALGLTGGAIAVAIGALAGVATVRRGRARDWRPGA